MSLAGIQTTNILPFNDRQAFFHQRGQDIRQLGQALNSGDLAGAQQAYSALLALAQQNGASNAANANATANATAGPFRNPKIASDFAALGQALQAGDLAAAQQAFATFRHDLRSGRSQNGASQSANSTLPEIVINISGFLPDNSGSNPAANSPAPSTSAPADSSSSSSSSASATTAQASSTTSAPEIVLNLFGGNGSFAGPEIIFNFGNNSATSPNPVPAPSSSGQQTAPSNTQNSQNPEIVFNLANSGVSEIDVNLGGSNPGLVLKFAPAQSSSGNLNVVA